MVRRLLIVTGIAAVVAYLLRRRATAPVPSFDTDPAEELRRKLAEVRAGEAEQEDVGIADLDARREDVHARARAAVDEMQGSADGE